MERKQRSDRFTKKNHIAGYEVYDRDGEKIGKVDGLFVNENDQPEYINVKTDWPSVSSILIPSNIVMVDDDGRRLDVSVDKATLENSPVFHNELEITPEYEKQVLAHYELEGQQGVAQQRDTGGDYQAARPGGEQRAQNVTGSSKTKTFSVNTQKDPDTLVSEARQVAKENNATFEGDTSSGSFSGKGVEGNYEIEGQTVEVTITDKPTLAPWSKVESKVKEFFDIGQDDDAVGSGSSDWLPLGGGETSSAIEDVGAGAGSAVEGIGAGPESAVEDVGAGSVEQDPSEIDGPSDGMQSADVDDDEEEEEDGDDDFVSYSYEPDDEEDVVEEGVLLDSADVHITRNAEVPKHVDVILSAEGPPEILIGQDVVIPVRAEVAAKATPLDHAVKGIIDANEEKGIVAIISVRGTAVRVKGSPVRQLGHPGVAGPVEEVFAVSSEELGSAEIAILFEQGGLDIGQVSFVVEVVSQSERQEPVRKETFAEQNGQPDKDRLKLVIIQPVKEGNEVRYDYLVSSDVLKLENQPYSTKPFQIEGTGSATLRYVRSITKKIVDRIIVSQDDLKELQIELETIGTGMCRRLFNDDFVRHLWKHKDDIKSVQVTSFEPYIPWELLRLRNPDTGEVDDKHLCEYGLVRVFGGRMPEKKLNADEWRYLRAKYSYDLYDDVGQEVEHLKAKLAKHGIEPRETEPKMLSLVEALENPDFDVLHISCHGETDQEDIELTRLVLADRLVPNDDESKMIPAPVTIEPETVSGKARLDGRSRLIFLNACETAQQAPSLTTWGGWPYAFWETGADAFVGTAWSVREEPATAFADTFYDALLEKGLTLAEAAATGREAAKAEGDGSWLAFVVYGNREARLIRTPAS